MGFPRAEEEQEARKAAHLQGEGAPSPASSLGWAWGSLGMPVGAATITRQPLGTLWVGPTSPAATQGSSGPTCSPGVPLCPQQPAWHAGRIKNKGGWKERLSSTWSGPPWVRAAPCTPQASDISREHRLPRDVCLLLGPPEVQAAVLWERIKVIKMIKKTSQFMLLFCPPCPCSNSAGSGLS